MKIATFNIWNADRGMPRRGDEIVAEILRADADIIGLQEVTESFRDALLENMAYSHRLCIPGPSAGQGLAFLSRYPVLCPSDHYGVVAELAFA